MVVVSYKMPRLWRCRSIPGNTLIRWALSSSVNPHRLDLGDPRAGRKQIVGKASSCCPQLSNSTLNPLLCLENVFYTRLTCRRASRRGPPRRDTRTILGSSIIEEGNLVKRRTANNARGSPTSKSVSPSSACPERAPSTTNPEEKDPGYSRGHGKVAIVPLGGQLWWARRQKSEMRWVAFRGFVHHHPIAKSAGCGKVVASQCVSFSSTCSPHFPS